MKKLKPFKWFCMQNFPFIEADYDAVTEWQLLQQIGAQCKDLTNAVLQIQEYLNDLDLQDEVNNKLDEMAESGELEEIISAYLQTSALICFNTVADLKLAENLINGSYAKTLGFYSLNDGGHGTYKIREITNEDVVDEMSLLSLADENLVAELIINDELNIACLGAVSNDQNKTELNTNAIHKAFNLASIVVIPEGDYYVSTITMPKEHILKGLNNKKSTLKYNGSPNNSIIKIGNSEEGIYDTNIINLRLRQTEDISNINGIEYWGHNPAYSIIKNCNIGYLTGDGIKGGHAGHVNNIEILENFITGCKNGINMQYSEGQINAIWIHHNNIVHSTNAGILFYGNNVIIENNTIQANVYGILIGESTWDESFTQFCFASSIRNNYFEQNTNPITLYNGYSSERTYNRFIRNLEIQQNYFVENIEGIIKVYTEEGSDISANSCNIDIENNYSISTNFLVLNIPNALSYGSIYKNNSNTDYISLPYYVNQNFFKRNDPLGVHFDNYMSAEYQYNENVGASQENQITYLIYCDSDTLSETACNQVIRQTHIKASINGHYEYGSAGRYNTYLEKNGFNNGVDYSTVTKENENDTVKLLTPFISPITLVKNHPALTGNATIGLQVTILQQGTNSFPYRLFLEMLTSHQANRHMIVKRLTPTKNTGAGVPSEIPNYIGEVYFNTTNRTWYVADTSTTWASTGIIQ